VTAPSQNRALALDALRGLAILAMLLSGQLPFNQNALPSWMYHAQVPPPAFQWNGSLPGITWVDLVFPFFLFSMGAAFPLALSRRLENKTPAWKLFLFIFERGFLLAFFALFVQAIRPDTLSSHPTTATWLLALLGFLILFAIFTRLPEAWPRAVKFSIRSAGWLAAILFFTFITYPDGSGFRLTRSDIIIVVLANTAVFGSLAWMLTRERVLPRLGLLGILLAIRLSNLPQPAAGWVHDLWKFSPAPWIYQLYYLQYLFLVIPGTIAGDLILKWTRAANPASEKKSSTPRLVSICALMVAFVAVLLAGLKARWLVETTLLVFAMCLAGWRLLARPLSETERLCQKHFNWAIYWLVLGLVFEPWEGGIKKDHPTLSYYFVTAGLAICVLIGFSILIDVFRQTRWLQLLIDNGQNPMIAYAGINNLITPLLALVGADRLLSHFAATPWRGFCKGVIVTLLLAVAVSFLTRKKLFWRT
jgi:predicted acyltransferase